MVVVRLQTTKYYVMLPIQIPEQLLNIEMLELYTLQ